MKNRYWLYFIGMCLVALSRNAFSLVLPALFCAELFFFLNERKIRQSITRLLAGIAPVLAGTVILVIIQHAQGSEEFTKFLSVQKYWGHAFSLPNLLRMEDWSHESFGINIPAIICIGIPVMGYLGVIFLSYCRAFKLKHPLFALSSANRKDYALVVSLFCCLAAFSVVLLTQGGNLHGLARFVLASPYFVVALLLGFDKIGSVSRKLRTAALILSIILSSLVLVFTPYTNVSPFFWGTLIFFLTMGLYLFQDMSGKRGYRVLLSVNFALNIVWTTYLFNVYISNGWNFL